MESCESGLQEQTRPRAFLAFSSSPPPSLSPALHPGWFSAVVLITCLCKQLSWNLPLSLETLPGSSDAPEGALCSLSLFQPPPQGMAAGMAPQALGQEGPYAARRHPTVSAPLKQLLWGLAWLCCGHALGLSMCLASSGLSSPLTSLLLVGSYPWVLGAGHRVVVLFLLTETKALPGGFSLSSAQSLSDARCWLFATPR